MIGRVEEENEIVINHRSISRTHAKIIHRQGEFILLDMGSSNGITLNNESNVKTSPLRNGDLIVMGMVKLRFVAPGDDYVFNPKDIDDQNLDKSQSHKDVMFIIMLLLTALISAWLVSKYLVRQKNTESPATIEIQKPTMPNPELEPAPMEDAVAPNDQKAESQSVVDAGIDPKKEEIDQALAPENTTNTETAPTETEVNSGEETLKSSKSKKKKTKAQEEK
jgi:pSer/pThr/pTyr-binding forkhead associated (FHA) protein